MRDQNLVDHVLGKAEDAAAAGHKMVDMKVVDAFEACPTLKPKPPAAAEDRVDNQSLYR